MQDPTKDPKVIPDAPEDYDGPDRTPGLGEEVTTVGGGLTVGDAVPTMPPPVGDPEAAPDSAGGGLTADDLAQPTSTGDPTGDRATGLTGMRE